MAAPDRHPADLLLSGAGTDIDVLIGWTREEANCAFALSEPYAGTTREQVLARARAAFGSRAAEACTAYEEARPGARPLDVLMELITDELFRMPGVALAERRAARGRPVWAYRFNLPTPAHDGRLGAAHCLELPFVFDNFDKWSRAPFLAGLAPRVRDGLAAAVHASWRWDRYGRDSRTTMTLDSVTTAVEDVAGYWRRLHHPATP
ncbi:carboxylesterase family protein [Streptomyces erythrochromogenes]|uniref:carboxylesterase family protein n=1 Tax=Streptomyces erythrochromogenes TaxID=285574 RepID=UPI00382DCA9B